MRRRPTRQPLAPNGVMRLASHYVARQGVQFLSQSSALANTSASGMIAGGLPCLDSHKGMVLWSSFEELLVELLKDNGQAAMRLHCVLSARAYAENLTGDGWVDVSIDELLDDLGYTRHNGTHRPENRETLLKLLLLLDRIFVRFVNHRKGQAPQHLLSRLWLFGSFLQEANLDGSLRTTRVRYQQGPANEIPEWFAANNYTALVSQRILALKKKNEKWAAAIGWYVSIFGPYNRNNYADRHFEIGPLMDKVGLAREYVDHDERPLDYLTRALDLLEDREVIATWRWKDEAKDTVIVSYLPEIRSLAKPTIQHPPA